MNRRLQIMTLTLAMALPAITSAASSSNNPTTATQPKSAAHATHGKASDRRIHSRKEPTQAELNAPAEALAAKAAAMVTVPFTPSAKAPNQGKPLTFQQLHDITYGNASRANLTPAQEQQATGFLYNANRAEMAASQGDQGS